MSVSSEWFDARRTIVNVVTRGYVPLGCDEPVETPLALALSGDAVAFITGDRESLRELLLTALDELDSPSQHVGPDEGW